MVTDIKKKTASGFAYKFAERVGAQGISFLVQIVLARILLPEEYGLIGLTTVFIAICDVFVTYGFGNSLVINKESDDTDFSTCFYFGLFLSSCLYILFFLGAPLISKFYDNISLIPIVRVMALRIPIASINSVQHAYVQKNMWFKKFFYATLIGTVVSGSIAVIMAKAGFGVWSLVAQYLVNSFVDTLCLWFLVGWRPTKEFSFERLKSIYSFGWKILLVGLIDTLYSKIRSLIIGKKYSNSDLAYYEKGNRFPVFCMRLIEPTVNTVLLPTLSQCQDDQDQMREITRRVMMASTFIISPIMVGLAVVAKPLVTVLLTSKWLPCVVYLQIGCLANLFRPNQFINNCVIKASGNSGLLLRLDVLKKSVGIIILLISMHFGLFWIAFSLVIVYLFSMIINIAPNRKILNYGYAAQAKDFLNNLIPAIIMGGCVYPLSFIKMRAFVLLIVQVIAGVLVYWAIAVVTKNESYRTTYAFAKQMIKRYLVDTQNTK